MNNHRRSKIIHTKFLVIFLAYIFIPKELLANSENRKDDSMEITFKIRLGSEFLRYGDKMYGNITLNIPDLANYYIDECKQKGKRFTFNKFGEAKITHLSKSKMGNKDTRIEFTISISSGNYNYNCNPKKCFIEAGRTDYIINIISPSQPTKQPNNNKILPKPINKTEQPLTNPIIVSERLPILQNVDRNSMLDNSKKIVTGICKNDYMIDSEVKNIISPLDFDSNNDNSIFQKTIQLFCDGVKNKNSRAEINNIDTILTVTALQNLWFGQYNEAFCYANISANLTEKKSNLISQIAGIIALNKKALQFDMNKKYFDSFLEYEKIMSSLNKLDGFADIVTKESSKGNSIETIKCGQMAINSLRHVLPCMFRMYSQEPIKDKYTKDRVSDFLLFFDNKETFKTYFTHFERYKIYAEKSMEAEESRTAIKQMYGNTVPELKNIWIDINGLCAWSTLIYSKKYSIKFQSTGNESSTLSENICATLKKPVSNISNSVLINDSYKQFLTDFPCLK